MKNAVLAKILGLSIVVVMFSGLTIVPAFAIGTPTTGDLYFTTFSGTPNVHKITYTWNGATLTLSPITDLASTVGADGIIFAPNGHLLVGGQGPTINDVQLSPLVITPFPAGTPACFHISKDPNNNIAYCGGIPGPLGKIPVNPTGPGINLPIIGPDTTVDSLAFVGGTVFYTSSGPGGIGNFGTINLSGSPAVTTRILTGIPAHGMAYDSNINRLLLFGANFIVEINPATPAVPLAIQPEPGISQFDQGAVDGNGHVFIADNAGNLFFMDYSSTGMVNTPDFITTTFLANNLDDIAPLSGAGSNQPHPVGGIIIPVDMTALFIAGAMSNAFWVLPSIGGISAALAFYKTRRRVD